MIFVKEILNVVAVTQFQCHGGLTILNAFYEIIQAQQPIKLEVIRTVTCSVA